MVYYVNHSRIRERQRFVQELAGMAWELMDRWEDGLVCTLAQERILHMAIEAVTDIGSDLIDGFMMRDASSYEDIIEVLRGEGAVDDGLARYLQELVSLRKPLVQEYYAFSRDGLYPLLKDLPDQLSKFVWQVDQFIESQPLK